MSARPWPLVLLLLVLAGCPDFGSDSEQFCAINPGKYGCPPADGGAADGAIEPPP